MQTIARQPDHTQSPYAAIDGPQMLAARDERAARQREWLGGQTGCCLVSATMNIAGPVKNSPLIERGFRLGMLYVEDTLKNLRAPVLRKQLRKAATGCEALFLVRGDAAALKRAMVGVEQASPLGRLLDLDVLDGEGAAISRRQLGFDGRRCLLCQNPAQLCARSRRHPLEEICSETQRLLLEAVAGARADAIASAACRAMLYEVLVTPKPGLVDRNNSGSHRDMDIFSFAASAGALTPYFRRAYLLGVRDADTPCGELLSSLRSAGRLAEEEMKRATGGVNTHKGLIYSLGLLCGALGRCEGAGGGADVDVDAALAVCGALAAETLRSDLTQAPPSAETFGLRLFAQTGETGVRGEAARGFPSVCRCGLPVLTALLQRGLSLNDAGAYTLLALLCRVTDTNMIARGGHRAADEAQQAARALWGDTETIPSALPPLEALAALDGAFIRQNLSPGGCADLLAMTFMLYFLSDANGRFDRCDIPCESNDDGGTRQCP